MNNSVFLIGIFFLCMVGSILYRKWVINKTLKKLFSLRQQKDETSFMNALDAIDVKLYFPKFTRVLLRLNYYVDSKNEKNAIAAYEEIKTIKTNRDNIIAMYMKMYGYFLEIKDQNRAKECYEELHRKLAQSNAKNKDSILREVEQLDAVYIQKDIEWIPVLVEGINQVKDDEYRSILLFRLAKLYYYAKNELKCKEVLMEALDATKNPSTQKQLQYVLHHLEELE